MTPGDQALQHHQALLVDQLLLEILTDQYHPLIPEILQLLQDQTLLERQQIQSLQAVQPIQQGR